MGLIAKSPVVHNAEKTQVTEQNLNLWHQHLLTFLRKNHH